MEINEEFVKEKIKKAKKYGLSYAKLARAINIQPISIYTFISGRNKLSKAKQIDALCIAEDFLASLKEKIILIESFNNELEYKKQEEQNNTHIFNGLTIEKENKNNEQE